MLPAPTQGPALLTWMVRGGRGLLGCWYSWVRAGSYELRPPVNDARVETQGDGMAQQVQRTPLGKKGRGEGLRERIALCSSRKLGEKRGNYSALTSISLKGPSFP